MSRFGLIRDQTMRRADWLTQTEGETAQRELIERARSGDQEAFASMVRAMSDHLYAVAFRIVRDTGQAEDATQQALLAMWRNLRGLRDLDRFDAWSYRLLVNACFAELRKSRTWRTLSVLPDTSSEPDASAQIVDRDQLRRAFHRISPQQRAVVVLHHYVGLSLPRIAEALGISEGTVRSRLYYGLRGMRAAIEIGDRPGRARGMA
jgi:RNA polymerase sigma factor (sigma-70 family)